ncbi:hypothetical protein AtNW77_Chr1g0023681 [Arabidopsis thaliana]
MIYVKILLKKGKKYLSFSYKRRNKDIHQKHTKSSPQHYKEETHSISLSQYIFPHF